MAFSVSKRVKIPGIVENVSRNEQGDKQEAPLIGGILSDTNYVWQAKGPYLEVRDTKKALIVGCWTFGSVLKDSDTKILFVKELKPVNGGLGLLAVALDCTISGGIICLFNVFCSKVIRAINVKKRISSLHIIDPGIEVLNLPGPLRDFDGIISIGTDDGDVLVVDLCRQICERTSSHLLRDELSPSQLLTITPNKIQKIEKFREKAIDDGDHLAIHLNVVLNSETEHFTLKGPKGENRAYVNRDEVQTSALHYCPQLTSLLVGYNFGAFQLWDLTSFQLMYTSAVCEEHIPISHFCLLEPTDDPRAFCYIWVSYSNLAMYHRGLPFAVMYSLSYDSKEHHEGYGYLYQDFQHCSVRYKVELGALQKHTSGNNPKGGLCLGFQSITKASSCKDTTLQPTKGDVLVLCQISWTIWYHAGEIENYAVIFDLNQWYKEQMPKFSKWNNTVNYVLKIDLNNYIAPSNSSLMATEVNLASLKQFVAIQKLEEHFYPTSLTLDMIVLTRNEVILIHTKGLQKALLEHIQATGPICLLKPDEIYQKICSLGLTPLFVDANSNPSLSVDFKREVILNTVVEHSLTSWLYHCASEWANGRFSSSGCSLDYLLNWAFQRAVVLKFNCDNFCVPLFDYSQFSLDHNTSLLLRSGTVQLNTLFKFYSFVMKALSEHITDINVAMEQRNSLEMAVTYFEVLQWLVNVGLLPECHPTAYPIMENSDKITAPYPVKILTEYYVERRSQLQSLSQQRFTSSDSLLFIDNLMNNNFGTQLLQKQWQEDGGSGLYPPPSLQSLLRTYLMPGTNICNKHLLVLYLFLDLATILDQSLYSSIITYLIKFPAVFKVTPSMIKITQAFWHLDHGDYHTAIEQLLNPSILKDDLQPWCHTLAMRSLLLQNQHKAALYYMQVKKPPIIESDDLLTAISLYISNNMLAEAFYFMRENCQEEERFLIHLFNECNKNTSLHLLLYKNLNEDEEKAFLKYLRTLKNSNMSELEVFYYLLRSRFVEGFEAHYSNLKNGRPECQGLFGQRNASKANQIVNTFKNLLPDVHKNLVEFVRKEKNNVWKEVPKPTPLSVFVHNNEEKIWYKSTMIHAAISKAKDTFDRSPAQKFNQTLPATEDTPFLRTPTAFKSPSRHAIPVITPRVVEFNEGGEMGPSPPKRIKLTPRLSTSSVCNRSDIAHSQLLTPFVKRNQSPCRERSPSNSNIISAPQSILKVRGQENEATFNEKNSTIMTGVSPRKSALGLTPRRSLARQHVQFEDSVKDLSTPTEQNSNRADLTDSQDQTSSIKISISSCELSSLSKSISLNSEDYFSVNSSYDNTKSDQQNESESLIVVDEQAEETMKEDVDIQFSNTPPGKLFSPKARRSYKRGLEEMSPIRSSPRLSRRLVESKSELNERTPFALQEESPILSTKSLRIPVSEQVSADKTPLLNKTEEEVKVFYTESESPVNVSRPYRKITGRKSLSREVLEHNTFSKLHAEISPSREIISREVSYSETTKTKVRLESPRKSESTIFESEVNTSNLSSWSMSSPKTPCSSDISALSAITFTPETDYTSSSSASEPIGLSRFVLKTGKEQNPSETEVNNIHQNAEHAKEEIVEQQEEICLNEETKTTNESLEIIEQPADINCNNTNLNEDEEINTPEEDDVIMQVYQDLSCGSEDEISSENTNEDDDEFNISNGNGENQNSVILEQNLAFIEYSPNKENTHKSDNTVIEISSGESTHEDSTSSNDTSEDYENEEAHQNENPEEEIISEADCEQEHSDSTEESLEDIEREQISQQKSEEQINLNTENVDKVNEAHQNESPEEEIISEADCEQEHSDSTEESLEDIEREQLSQQKSEEQINLNTENVDKVNEAHQNESPDEEIISEADCEQEHSDSTEESLEDIEREQISQQKSEEQINLNTENVDKVNEAHQNESPEEEIISEADCEQEHSDSTEESLEDIEREQISQQKSEKQINLNTENVDKVNEISSANDDIPNPILEINEPNEIIAVEVDENKKSISTLNSEKLKDEPRQSHVTSESNEALKEHQANEKVVLSTVDKSSNTSQFVGEPLEVMDTSSCPTEDKSVKPLTSINTTFIDKIRKSEKIQTYPSKLTSKQTSVDGQSTSSSDNIKDASNEVVVKALVHSSDRPVTRRLTRRAVSTDQIEKVSEEKRRITRQSSNKDSEIDTDTSVTGIKRGSKRSRSTTPSNKNSERSEGINCNMNASQEILQDKVPLTRRTRSISVDQRKTYSNPSRASSVSSLPVVTEEDITKTKKNVDKKKEDYHISRRLTRTQAKLVKNAPKIDEVEIEASDAENDGEDSFDPINLLDKESFNGEPDLEEQNYYTSKRITRSASNASEISLASSASPVKRNARGKGKQKAYPSARVQTRSMSHSDVSSVVSESGSPPKKSRRAKISMDLDDNVSNSSRTSNRSKASSVNSGTSLSKGSKRKTYSKKSTLDKIEEEASTSAPKRSTRRKNK